MNTALAAPQTSDSPADQVVIIGGGPGGYEAALVARQLGADVTLIERQGLGGSAVLTDVVPSKSLIATAEFVTNVENGHRFGVSAQEGAVHVDLGRVNERILALAGNQSADIRTRVEREGVRVINGVGRLRDRNSVVVGDQVLSAEVILIATGATPRTLPDAMPDGERILTWTQLYGLRELPEHLIVVGSGVTGAEFAGAFTGLGGQVTLVSSRERVLPGEDADAATVLEEHFNSRGMNVLSRSRAGAVTRTDSGVAVRLEDGRVVQGSHCLMAVGAVPNTADLGLAEAGVHTSSSGHITVDGVSRTSMRGVYAAGDVTGVLPLASVAASQGRIAMRHALGDAVIPLDTSTVAANIFTTPEIATVGLSEMDLERGDVHASKAVVPLARNPRAKMLDIRSGFVKLFARKGSGSVLGGVVVAPRASELIYPISLAVANRLTVDEMSQALTVYPSLSGSIGEAARVLHELPSH